MDGPLKGLFVKEDLHSRRLADLPTEAVELVPFDITLALRGAQATVDTVALTDAVTQWMNENFQESVASVGYRYNFGRVVLRTLKTETSSANDRKLLSQGTRDLQSAYKVTYDGMSYWGTDREVPSQTTVAAMQVILLLNRDSLLAKLQAESSEQGLGDFVVDARGDSNPTAEPPVFAPEEDDSLDVIIIVAIVIAVLASLLLIFAVFMAWKTGKQRKESYHDGTRQAVDPDADGQNEQPRTRGDTDGSPTIGPYPDSVITDDISSSLSAYYKSGMAGGYKANRSQHGNLNDAASVSSMESYGYSLDGYASSIAN